MKIVRRPLLEQGFGSFHPDWPAAAEDLCERWRELRSEAA